MISINKGEQNTIVLTLSERLTLPSSAYVFKFIHDQSGAEKVFAGQDQSLFQERYNLFNIEETDVEDFYSAKVELKEGFHHYYIYEVSPSSPPVITPSDLLLEEGKVLVTNPSKPVDKIYTGNDGINNKVYNG
jgi:hypothetical protein